jgi:hypothetical protein
VAAELSLFIFTQCATEFPNEPLSIAVRRDCGVTPFAEAAKTLEELLCHNPTHFLSNKAIAALGGEFAVDVWVFVVRSLANLDVVNNNL